MSAGSASRVVTSWSLVLVLAASVFGTACSRKPDSGEDAEVVKRGTLEITAALVEIPGPFPSNDLDRYDYASVLKYEVKQCHRGALKAGDILYIGHYNPLKQRRRVADERVPDIGGNLERYRAGDVHRMALGPSMDDAYMGPIVNKYFKETVKKGVPLYWAEWTNHVFE